MDAFWNHRDFLDDSSAMQRLLDELEQEKAHHEKHYRDWEGWPAQSILVRLLDDCQNWAMDTPDRYARGLWLQSQLSLPSSASEDSARTKHPSVNCWARSRQELPSWIQENPGSLSIQVPVAKRGLMPLGVAFGCAKNVNRWLYGERERIHKNSALSEWYETCASEFLLPIANEMLFRVLKSPNLGYNAKEILRHLKHHPSWAHLRDTDGGSALWIALRENPKVMVELRKELPKEFPWDKVTGPSGEDLWDALITGSKLLEEGSAQALNQCRIASKALKAPEKGWLIRYPHLLERLSTYFDTRQDYTLLSMRTAWAKMMTKHSEWGWSGSRQDHRDLVNRMWRPLPPGEEPILDERKFPEWMEMAYWVLQTPAQAKVMTPPLRGLTISLLAAVLSVDAENLRLLRRPGRREAPMWSEKTFQLVRKRFREHVRLIDRDKTCVEWPNGKEGLSQAQGYPNVFKDPEVLAWHRKEKVSPHPRLGQKRSFRA